VNVFTESDSDRTNVWARGTSAGDAAVAGAGWAVAPPAGDVAGALAIVGTAVLGAAGAGAADVADGPVVGTPCEQADRTATVPPSAIVDRARRREIRRSLATMSVPLRVVRRRYT
jgi:hypothetical protein